MKSRISLSIAFSTSLLLLLLCFAHCGKKSDPEPTETEAQKATKLLTAGQWSVQSVSVDGQDRSSTYKDLKLTFSATSITATNGGAIWPASTTWKFKDDTGKTIERGDGLSIAVAELSASKLVLALSWSKTTLGGGRALSISGQHNFTFTK